MVHSTPLAEQVRLPNGVVLKNRIAKAAMTEGLSDGTNKPNDRMVTLYRRWGAGGAGLLITGNTLIDRWHLERGGNLAIEGAQSNADLAKLADIASAAQVDGAKIIVQLNHAGRQTQKMINKTPKSASDVGLKMGNGRFGTPTPMSKTDIQAVVDGFVHAANICKQTGFDGVQVHAAHGYLMSQFLSPLSNLRDDRWGGSLQNRARLLIDIVRGIRKTCGPKFIVSVKLNSADFQKGGFSQDDSVQVAAMLSAAGIDLLEVSGGNYEQPRMIDFNRKDPLANKRESTRKREAYFLDFIPKLRKAVDIPIMVTGGFRSVSGMEAAINEDDVDVIGLGRPLVLDVNAAKKLLSGELTELHSRDDDLVIGSGLLGPKSPIGFLRDLNAWGALGWYYEQIYALADGKEPDENLSPFKALLAYDKTEGRAAKALVR